MVEMPTRLLSFSMEWSSSALRSEWKTLESPPWSESSLDLYISFWLGPRAVSLAAFLLNLASLGRNCEAWLLIWDCASNCFQSDSLYMLYPVLATRAAKEELCSRSARTIDLSFSLTQRLSFSARWLRPHARLKVSCDSYGEGMRSESCLTAAKSCGMTTSSIRFFFLGTSTLSPFFPKLCASNSVLISKFSSFYYAIAGSLDFIKSLCSLSAFSFWLNLRSLCHESFRPYFA